MISSLQHKLLVDVSRLARSPALADIHLKCTSENEEEEDTEPIPAHKFVLGARSPVFYSMFTNGMKECTTAASLITVHFKRNDFLKIIDFLYSGNIELEHESVLETLAISDFYGLEDVRKLCIAFIVDNIAVMDCVEVLQYAHQYDRYLSDFCLRYIATHSREALSSAYWEYLNEEMVVALLKLDLHLPETEIFDAVIRWAKATCTRDGEGTDKDVVFIKAANALKYVRFGTMLPSQLMLVEKTDLVSKGLCIFYYALCLFVQMCSLTPIVTWRQTELLQIQFKFNTAPLL